MDMTTIDYISNISFLLGCCGYRQFFIEKYETCVSITYVHERFRTIDYLNPQCVNFLSKIDDIIQTNEWNDQTWAEECCKWWTLLVGVVDIPNQDHPDVLLEPLLFSPHHMTLCQREKSVIMKCVSF